MYTSPGWLAFSDSHNPQAWALGPSSWAVGSAQLGPDHLQGLKCSKETEPLLRPPSESEFVAMIELLNGGGNRGGEQLLCHLGDPPGILPVWTDDQMA